MACDYCKGPILKFGEDWFVMEASKAIPADFMHTPLELRVRVFEFEDGSLTTEMEAAFDVKIDLGMSIKYSGEDDGAICEYLPESYGYTETFTFRIDHCPICGGDLRENYRRSRATEEVEGEWSDWRWKHRREV